MGAHEQSLADAKQVAILANMTDITFITVMAVLRWIWEIVTAIITKVPSQKTEKWSSRSNVETTKYFSPQREK